MYSSLDRIDIVTKKQETGRAGYVLTDHRKPAEIEAEPELSVLFALTRVAAAAAMGAREGGADVIYVASEVPPEPLREAVAAAGGSVHVGVDRPLATPNVVRPIGEIADSAFAGLARRVAARETLGVEAALLQRLEDATLHRPPKQDDEEPLYWQRCFELAAVTGELLRAQTGGRWAEVPDRDGIFPFAFSAGDGVFNVADKAQRFMELGESQRPSQLLLMADDIGKGFEGPLMPNLKPGDYPREQGVWRELLPGAEKPDPDPRLPLVFLGRDQPNTFAYLPAGSPDVEQGFEEALANLGRLELEAVKHEVAGVEMLVVSDHFYASEKILDQAFMQALHRRLKAELLAAAVPYKGLLLVTDQVVPPGIAGFVAAASVLHGQTGGAPPLSPIVFLVKDGKLVGHVETDAKQSGKPGTVAAGRPGTVAGKPRPSSRLPSKRPEPQGFWAKLLKRGGGH